tara:strand:+ start:845 stop:1147 length:303 start_codon:yes stop_codon:yes gene_type:complete
MQCEQCNKLYGYRENKPIVCAPCGHTICDMCVLNWRLPNNKCPICKMDVKEIALNRAVIDILNSDINTTNLLILQRMNQLNNNILQMDRRLNNNDCCCIN